EGARPRGAGYRQGQTEKQAQHELRVQKLFQTVRHGAPGIAVRIYTAFNKCPSSLEHFFRRIGGLSCGRQQPDETKNGRCKNDVKQPSSAGITVGDARSVHRLWKPVTRYPWQF